MEELHCRFLGVTVGDETVEDEVAAAAGSLAGGDGFMNLTAAEGGRVHFLMVLEWSLLEEARIFEVVWLAV